MKLQDFVMKKSKKNQFCDFRSQKIIIFYQSQAEFLENLIIAPSNSHGNVTGPISQDSARLIIPRMQEEGAISLLEAIANLLQNSPRRFNCYL